MNTILQHYNYVVVIVLMMTGLYVVFASSNMIKKLVGLSVFQTSVFLLYISMGKVSGGKPPIIDPKEFNTHHGDEAAMVTSAHDAGTHNETAPATGSHDVEHMDGLSDVVNSATDHASDIAQNGADHSGGAVTNVLEQIAPLDNGHAVIEQAVIYSNPLPHVLILTAIVVGVATLAIGLALVVRIRETYGTIEEDEIDALDYQEQVGAGVRI